MDDGPGSMVHAWGMQQYSGGMHLGHLGIIAPVDVSYDVRTSFLIGEILFLLYSYSHTDRQ